MSTKKEKDAKKAINKIVLENVNNSKSETKLSMDEFNINKEISDVINKWKNLNILAEIECSEPETEPDYDDICDGDPYITNVNHSVEIDVEDSDYLTKERLINIILHIPENSYIKSIEIDHDTDFVRIDYTMD